VAIIVIFHLFSVLPLSLCGSAVMVFRILLTTEAQRTPRLHRDKMEIISDCACSNLLIYLILGYLGGRNLFAFPRP